MTKGQRVVTIIVIIWWFVGGLISFMATSEGYSTNSIDYLINFITTGLYLTIPMGFVWYMLKPRKGNND